MKTAKETNSNRQLINAAKPFFDFNNSKKESSYFFNEANSNSIQRKNISNDTKGKEVKKIWLNELSESDEVRLIDSIGNLVYSSRLKETIQIEHLDNGLYLLVIAKKEGEEVKEKISKEDESSSLELKFVQKPNHSEIETKAKEKARLGDVEGAVLLVLQSYGLGHINLNQIKLRPPADTSIVLTTEGDIDVGAKQDIRVPANIFDFPFDIIVNQIAHEAMHIGQKSDTFPVTNKNEREFSAYYENVFSEKNDHLPPSPIDIKKQFANQALRYFRQMGSGSQLQQKYSNEQERLVEFVEKN